MIAVCLYINFILCDKTFQVVMKELKIDVDNLCSFMPQDKVQIPAFFLELFILLFSIVVYACVL